jgi:hypothetical protein
MDRVILCVYLLADKEIYKEMMQEYFPISDDDVSITSDSPSDDEPLGVTDDLSSHDEFPLFGFDTGSGGEDEVLTILLQQYYVVNYI